MPYVSSKTVVDVVVRGARPPSSVVRVCVADVPTCRASTAKPLRVRVAVGADCQGSATVAVTSAPPGPLATMLSRVVPANAFSSAAAGTLPTATAGSVTVRVPPGTVSPFIPRKNRFRVCVCGWAGSPGSPVVVRTHS